MTAAVHRRHHVQHHTTEHLKGIKTPLKGVDQNVSNIAHTNVKGHHTEKSLPAKIKDRVAANQAKNDRNIFNHLLNVKGKLQCKAHDIAVAIRHCNNVAESGRATTEEARDIRKFFDKISNLDAKMFDRHALLGGKVALQCLLSKELDDLMKLEKADPALKTSTNHQLNIALAKAKLAINLGHEFEKAKEGQNGTVLVKSLENEYVGVFKAPQKLGWLDFRAHFKKYLGQARLLNQKDGLGQQFAEVAAHKFDKIMGLNMAPAARMAEIKGQNGAFIAFLPGYKELSTVEASLQKRKQFTDHEKKIWQMAAIANFFKGNMDPHNQNVFVKTDKAGKLSEIRMIDHGNCFIEANPGAWGSKGNQGCWGKYTISKEPFTKEVLDFIQNELTEEKLEAFVKEIGGERQEFWSQGMDHQQRVRLEVLKKCVASGKIKTPEELARIHTQQDFQKQLQNVEKSKENSRRCEDGFVVIDIA